VCSAHCGTTSRTARAGSCYAVAWWSSQYVGLRVRLRPPKQRHFRGAVPVDSISTPLLVFRLDLTMNPTVVLLISIATPIGLSIHDIVRDLHAPPRKESLTMGDTSSPRIGWADCT